MATTSAIFVGWQYPARGREVAAQELFGQALGYYAKLQQEGKIESFEPVLLDPHGGDLSGFILVRGEPEKLDAVARSDEFIALNTRAAYLVDGFGVVRASIGEGLAKRMALWTKNFALSSTTRTSGVLAGLRLGQLTQLRRGGQETTKEMELHLGHSGSSHANRFSKMLPCSRTRGAETHKGGVMQRKIDRLVSLLRLGSVVVLAFGTTKKGGTMSGRWLRRALLGFGLSCVLATGAWAEVESQIERSVAFSSASASFSQSKPNFPVFADIRVQTGNTQNGIGTFVNVFVSTPQTGVVSGCFQIPDADFTVGLASSTLRTTIVPSGPNATPRCPSFVQGTTAVQFNLTWTPTGTTTTTSSSFSQSCGAFSSEVQSTTSIVRASATGTISGFVGTVTAGGSFPLNPFIGETRTQTEVQNSPDPSCVLLGLGLSTVLATGAGAVDGEEVLDDQRTVAFSSASASFRSRPNFLDFALIKVQTGNTQNGIGTFVDVSVFTPTGVVSGCFQIPDADFTVGLASSTLRTTIVPSGPNATPKVRCSLFVQGTTAVQLNLTWTPTGTTTTTSSSFSQSCGAFSFEVQSTTSIVRASATGTISGFVGTVTSGTNHPIPTHMGETRTQTEVHNSPDPSCVLAQFR
jgi:hypothetical protein